MRRLDVALLRPGVHGRLDFRFGLDAEDFAGNLEARFDELAGQVRGQRASGQAWVSTLPDGWRFDDVRLRLGATRIDLAGQIGARNDLRFDINASVLRCSSDARPSRGRQSRRWCARDRCSADRTWRRPRLRDLRLDSLRASVDVDPAGSGRTDALLRLDGCAGASATPMASRSRCRVRPARTVPVCTCAVGPDADARGRGRFHDGSGNSASLRWTCSTTGT
jgi:hypothetical protein